MNQSHGAQSSGLGAAWGTAGATAGLLAYIAVQALFSDAADRAGGVRFGVLLGLGVLAAALARFRPAPMVWILIGMTLGQIVVAFLLVVQGIGAPKVVAVLTAIFATGWAAAAVLMLVAHRGRR
jgi:hypothetical protein